MPRLFAVIVGVFIALAGVPADAQTSTQDLKRMRLDQILEIQVTTVSRVPQNSATAPAAVYVITHEDIRRSGATSIPQLLRLAPGVQVARMSGGTWSIGIRGFADRLARSMLVLIDGRAVYSPLFAGTYWETQDTVLADIDHIEVIRGPGGTLWGANAVNGIINIITKPAAETQGLLVDAGAGSEDRAFGSVRYGGSSGSLSYRGYFKAFDRGPEFHPDGNDYDGWRAGQGGFRADWHLSSRRSFTLQGDTYVGRLGERPTVSSYTSPFSQSTNVRAPLSGGNVIARLSGSGSKSDYRLQMYYDRTNRDEIPVGEARDTGDFDFQQTLRHWNRNTITWGAEYRVTSGRITAVAPSAFVPARRTDNLYTAFANDELSLVPGRLQLTVGSKVEHNDYSAFEIQPTARVAWTPDTANMLWAAITRAVRTPSRVETDYTTTSYVSGAAPPIFVRLMPNPDFMPEGLVAYQAGYRMRPMESIYVAVAGFYNDLQDTLSTELLNAFVEPGSGGPARLVLPVEFGNGLHGHSQGGEVTGDFRPVPWWRLTANYSYLDVSMTKDPGGNDVSQERTYEARIPHHQVQAGASVDISRWSADWMFRYVSALPAGPVPAYTASDVRVGWRLNPHVELSVVGQDLFHGHHLEWPNIGIERSVYARITWRP